MGRRIRESSLIFSVNFSYIILNEGFWCSRPVDVKYIRHLIHNHYGNQREPGNKEATTWIPYAESTSNMDVAFVMIYLQSLDG